MIALVSLLFVFMAIDIMLICATTAAYPKNMDYADRYLIVVLSVVSIIVMVAGIFSLIVF